MVTWLVEIPCPTLEPLSLNVESSDKLKGWNSVKAYTKYLPYSDVCSKYLTYTAPVTCVGKGPLDRAGLLA